MASIRHPMSVSTGGGSAAGFFFCSADAHEQALAGQPGSTKTPPRSPLQDVVLAIAVFEEKLAVANGTQACVGKAGSRV